MGLVLIFVTDGHFLGDRLIEEIAKRVNQYAGSIQSMG